MIRKYHKQAIKDTGVKERKKETQTVYSSLVHSLTPMSTPKFEIF